MDHASEPMLWLRPDGAIRYVNDAACALSGHDRDALLGRSVRDLDPTLDAAQWGTLRDALGSADAAPRAAQWVTANGTTVPVELTAGLVDFEGEPVLVVFAHDLRERQRIQARLMKADRLASLGSLAAGVAHEINNPLAYVIANLDLVHEGLTRREGGSTAPSYVELLQMVSDIADGTDRVRRIVGDLRSFARSGEERLGPVKVSDVLDTAVDIAANEIRHRAQLVRRYREVPPVLAEEGRLAQVFLNLLVNAAQAIPESGAGHRIAVTTDVDPEGLVVVEVSDTGVGIDPGVVDHVFDPFFTTKGVGEGTGLGLSICHGIVTSLGGTIEVHSQPGAGARFRVRLPTASAAPLQATPEPETYRPPPRQLRILVVDDEPLVCDGIRRALDGHEIVVAATGREAIRKCTDEDFDLVLCDVMMPDVSGMEVYGRVRSDRPEFEGRFVFMTGGAFTPKARAFLESIEGEQLAKPFTVHDLRELVDRRATD
jgi:PAS domain S-box-containing protein